MKKEEDPENKTNLKKMFFILLAIVALLNYAKILWPQILGIMKEGNISFWEAALNLKAHMLALTIFILITVAVIVYVFLFTNKK